MLIFLIIVLLLSKILKACFIIQINKHLSNDFTKDQLLFFIFDIKSKVMIKHSLICLLFDNPNGRFKTLRYNQDNSIEKIIEVYRHNLKNLQYILDYCHQQKINSYRISCDLFPLLGAQKFEDQINIVLEVLNNEIKNIKTYNIELSLHPDQFILLSSLNQNVNKNSIYFLNRWAQINLPINLINIHIGSKAAGFDKHKEIFIDQFDKLSAAAQNKLSIENDEKNYSIKEIINKH